jgi:hypothetical protein
MTDRLAEIEARLAKVDRLAEPHRTALGLCSWSCVDLEERDRLVEALVDDVPWLIARVRALEAQAAIGRLAQEYVVAINAEYETEILGLDEEAFGAEWERRWAVTDAAYERLQEKVDAALAAREKGE